MPKRDYLAVSLTRLETDALISLLSGIFISSTNEEQNGMFGTAKKAAAGTRAYKKLRRAYYRQEGRTGTNGNIAQSRASVP